MTHSIPRRSLLLASSSLLVSQHSAGQRTSPAADVVREGSLTRLTAESAVRPLHSIIYSLRQELRWQITFEECASVFREEYVDVTPDNRTGGRRIFNLKGGDLSITVESLGDTKHSSHKREVLQRAIEAHNSTNLPGRYRVIDSSPFFHVVPDLARDAQGEWQLTVGPLGEIVKVLGSGRLPQDILVELLEKVSTTSGASIRVGQNPFTRGDVHPRIELDFMDVPARIVLRHLLEAYQRPMVWSFLYGVTEKAYGLSIVNV